MCGPTVSGESHLGHARPYITFDVLYRYLLIWVIRYDMYGTLPMQGILKKKDVKPKIKFQKRL